MHPFTIYIIIFTLLILFYHFMTEKKIDKKKRRVIKKRSKKKNIRSQKINFNDFKTPEKNKAKIKKNLLDAFLIETSRLDFPDKLEIDKSFLSKKNIVEKKENFVKKIDLKQIRLFSPKQNKFENNSIFQSNKIVSKTFLSASIKNILKNSL